MIIRWLGHACFLVRADGYTVLLDPYGPGTVDGLRPLDVTANTVLCSHGHGDHAAVSDVQLHSADRPSPFTITKVDTWHDGEGGALRGPNTVHVLDAGGVRVAHLGDLGHALSPAQIEAVGRLVAVMLPIGGHYTIDAVKAKQVADALSASVVLPMHYRSKSFGFPVLDTLESFTSLCENVHIYDSDTVEVKKGMPRHVAVLQYQ